MKGLWLALAVCIFSLGCTSKPKREMRQSIPEEMPTLPPNQYTSPRDDLPRDQLLVPKSAGPNLNAPPNLPSAGAPGAVPGGSPGTVGGVRR